jgi:PAS domain S-box-containing protein
VSEAIKVLVVEDSEDDTQLAMMTLRRGGFELTHRRVQDADSLKAALEEERWDAVLCDFRLPGFSGSDALSIVRSVGIDVPFIFLSGTIGEETAVQAMKAGASDYVMKGNLSRLAPALERELAQAALRAERRRVQIERDRMLDLLQSICDNTAAVIYVKDLQGRYRMVNRRFTELFRVGSEQIIGKNDRELFPEETASALRSVDRRVVVAKAPVIEEEQVPQADGPHTYLSVKCPLRDREGHVQGVFGISTDITDRKRTEQALLDSEERMRLIIEAALDAVISIDAEGVITGWNPQAEVTFGWTRDEAIGRTLVDTIIPPQYHEAHRRGLVRYQKTREATVLNRRIELTARHRDGCEFPIELAITPIRSGLAPAFSAFVRDITERKHSESRVQAQLERLNLLDQITCAIGGRQDLQSIYQVAVRSLEERLPADFACICRYDALDNMLTVACVGAHSEALAAEMAMGERSGISVEANGLARCVRGQVVYEPDLSPSQFAFSRRLRAAGLHAVVVAPLPAEGRVFGVLITARRRANSFSSGECEFLRQLSAHVAVAAQQAQLRGSLQRAYDDLRSTQQAVVQQERLRALGQMASGIAHDINNAITPVMLYTESLLEGEPGLTPQGRNGLESIRRSIDDVAATVARMREFSRPREAQPAAMPLSLNRLVQQVIELTRARWSDMPQQRGIVIAVHSDLADDLPAVMGTQGEIREALINLVFNAVDAMPEGGELTLRTRAVGEPKAAQVEVSDTGIGMDEQTRRHCLEPFFTTKGERGTGLGLAMVYGAAQRHGAEISIDSTPGRGTSVVLHFPAPTASSQSTAAPQPVDRPPRMRILVVDDDPLLLRSLQDVLQADGHEVVAANAGQAGIDAFVDAQERGEPFAVVITDLGMPYVDGRRVASAVKQASPGTRVVLLTGWGQRLVDDEGVPQHVDQVLSKPPRLDELRYVLWRVAQPGNPEANA